jgi:hypothetical protein
MKAREVVTSEFDAPTIPFEEFAQSPAWASLPLTVKLAVLHLRRSELHPWPPEGDGTRSAPAIPGFPATEDRHL